MLFFCRWFEMDTYDLMQQLVYFFETSPFSFITKVVKGGVTSNWEEGNGSSFFVLPIYLNELERISGTPLNKMQYFILCICFILMHINKECCKCVMLPKRVPNKATQCTLPQTFGITQEISRFPWKPSLNLFNVWSENRIKTLTLSFRHCFSQRHL